MSGDKPRNQFPKTALWGGASTLVVGLGGAPASASR